MENYSLQTNETVLFKGSAFLLRTKKKITAEVFITNLNFVFIIKTKALFHKSTDKEIYDVKDVKIYDEKYQIIRKKKKVDIYMTSGEKFLEFEKEKQAKEFTDVALRLVSGNSKLVRGVKKARKAINETNKALDIDVLEIAKKTATIAGEATIAATTGAGVGKKTKMIGKIVSSIMHKQVPQENNLLETSQSPTEEE